jgi:hypothetical protein
MANENPTPKADPKPKTAEKVNADATGSDLPKLTDQVGDPVIMSPESVGPAPTTSDVIDPRSGEDFKTPDGYAGLSGFEALTSPSAGVPAVDPENKPVDVTQGVQPESGGDQLLAAAQMKAPNLTAEFVSEYGLTPADLGAIARGEVPPPPAIGPVHTTDLHLTPGGWQVTPPGVAPGETNAIRR